MQVNDKLGKCQRWDGCSRGKFPVVACLWLETRRKVLNRYCFECPRLSTMYNRVHDAGYRCERSWKDVSGIYLT